MAVFPTSLSMIYTGFKRVGAWWNYRNVISPFYRLYYIEKGCGKVYINHIGYDLTPGTLFLIPKFACHSYECLEFMDHYYICFFDDQEEGIGIPEPMQMNLKINAHEVDQMLVKRFLELNPGRSLPVESPQLYDNKRAIYEVRDDISANRVAAFMESQGILWQLFSRFVTEESVWVGHGVRRELDQVVQYVHQNLDKRIMIPELAELMCLTTDHFSKVFKRVIGMSPCEYIQMKRIERAQTLLLTTSMSIMQIAESVGIRDSSQFSRLFVKIAKCPPKVYREKQLSI